MSDIATPAAAIVAASSPYLTLKHAHALYAAPPDALTPEQRKKVNRVVAHQRDIEQRILRSQQAAHVVVSEESIAHGIAEISARFASETEFIADLARHGLNRETLRAEVTRELRVEAVLEAVSARIAPVSNLEAEIFYHIHFERFCVPERRTLRHILITYADANDRPQALARIQQIHTLLGRAPDRFAEQALRHSECPTAMQGGLLGQVPRGQLFPELDAVAFTMHAASLSDIIESPMGFHILRCENIQPAGPIPLANVRPKIREQILQTRRENKQRTWVRNLMAR